MAAKLLIIRFSSFGDIVQSMSVPAAFCAVYPGSEIDWLVRADFAELLHPHPLLRSVKAFDRRAGLAGLWKMASDLRAQNYTHIYDAHNNVRSRLILMFLRLQGASFQFARRPKNRFKRYLLFRWQMRLLPHPFRGIVSFQTPLKKWAHGLVALPPPPQFFIDPAASQKINDLFKDMSSLIALVPSAAWELKRWPIAHWQALILARTADHFVILGGPQDTFCEEIRSVAPDRVLNFAGKLSLQESAAVIASAKAVVANDTGLLHVSDQLGRKTVALIGPSAFGYPSHRRSTTAEIELWCKPCSKDGRDACKNDLLQRCMKELTPTAVNAKLDEVLKL